MIFFKKPLLLVLFSFFWEPSRSWAMIHSLEEKDKKISTSPKKRKEESSNNEAKKQKTKNPDSRPSVISQNKPPQQTLKQPEIPQKSVPQRIFFDQFKMGLPPM